MSPPLAPSPCSPIFSTLFPPLSVTNLSGVSLSFLCFLCKNEQLYVYCPFHSLLSHVVDTYSHFAFFFTQRYPLAIAHSQVSFNPNISLHLFIFPAQIVGETGCLSCRVSHRKVWALWVASPWCGLTSSSVPVFSPTGNCS